MAVVALITVKKIWQQGSLDADKIAEAVMLYVFTIVFPGSPLQQGYIVPLCKASTEEFLL